MKKPKGYISAFNFFLSKKRKELQTNKYYSVSFIVIFKYKRISYIAYHRISRLKLYTVTL